MQDPVSLIEDKVTVKSHLAEPVIAAVVQDRLSNGDGVQFARLLASATHLKVRDALCMHPILIA